jgi:NAD(P)-dependent dehydrogenase (short-subunit alcohol dehydrogenase family)
MIAEFSLAGIRERVIEQIPNGHMADAADVARLALFLISDESAYSTGSEFVIDGGMTA